MRKMFMMLVAVLALIAVPALAADAPPVDLGDSCQSPLLASAAVSDGEVALNLETLAHPEAQDMGPQCPVGCCSYSETRNWTSSSCGSCNVAWGPGYGTFKQQRDCNTCSGCGGWYNVQLLSCSPC